MTGFNRESRNWSTCEQCGGKRGFTTRKGAKTALRSHPDEGLKVYRCPHSNRYHIGHHRGRTRDQIRYGRKATA